MIFVTLGTNDKNFDRLLTAVENAILSGAIQEPVIAQTGYTKYKGTLMEAVSAMPQDSFEKTIDEARVIITHGGVGTIMTALSKGKTILAAARLSALGEHVNDHQIQLLEAFSASGYLIYMKDLNDIAPYLKEAETFHPRSYVSNRDHLLRYIETWIDRNT